MFQYNKPSILWVGTWSTWTKEDTEKFRGLHKGGKQVCILAHAKPYGSFFELSRKIDLELERAGFSWQEDYIIEHVPEIERIVSK